MCSPFIQEKALAGAFSVIVKTDGLFAALVAAHQLSAATACIVLSLFVGLQLFS